MSSLEARRVLWRMFVAVDAYDGDVDRQRLARAVERYRRWLPRYVSFMTRRT